MPKQPIHAVTLTACSISAIDPFMYAYVHRTPPEGDTTVKHYKIQTAHRLERVHLLQSLLMKG